MHRIEKHGIPRLSSSIPIYLKPAAGQDLHMKTRKKKNKAVGRMKSMMTVKNRSTRHRQLRFTGHESSIQNLGLEQVVENKPIDVGAC